MATLNDALHSRIIGQAPKNHRLEIRKRFISATSPVIDDPQAPPQEEVELTNPESVPAVGESEEAAFTVEGLPEADNGSATVEIGWPGGGDPEGIDWDVFVYDSDGDQVAVAASLANPEEAVLVDPAPGEYTVVVNNYAGGTEEHDWSGSVTFDGPTATRWPWPPRWPTPKRRCWWIRRPVSTPSW